MSAKQYARLVPKAHRAQRTPVIDRPMRPRMIAWAGPAAFYPNRFYEIDKWYKGRIDKPEQVPKLHIIDPANHLKSLAERQEQEKKNSVPCNIGFASRSQQSTSTTSEVQRDELERKARKMELFVDPDSTNFATLTVLNHYKVFEHLFGAGVFFENVQNVDVAYGEHGVYYGNTVSAHSTSSQPQVTLESFKTKSYNTLIMLNLDGNPYEKNGSIAHWIVSNIPDGKGVMEGDEVVKYVQPLPFCGTGYHRIVFLFFRHEQPLKSFPQLNSDSLEGRIFSLSHFYKQNEDVITPSSVLFFQTIYDESVKKQLHKMGELPIINLLLRNAVISMSELIYSEVFQAPKWLDPNYNENKKSMPAWMHRRLLAREGRYRALYDNSLKS
ncbi:phosphatidylethanolamine-binding protein [Necator americanus]|uniref:Large ribosomal subunit protein mL38 n=1 Tax=Necator americanus TaxID=51031 RepID=W2T6W6_NECAM|nr:phosphatidylethanolamine-binding protein [Necator americanus]ETN76742.1 phosphatidylethanolamine-binding protein [Necator americanus]